MAPEILGKKDYAGPPTDIWALGVILYYMICGAYPFKGSDETELYKKTRMAQFALPGYISQDVRMLIVSMLKSEPAERPTADRLLRDRWFDARLNEIFERKPSTKEEPPTERWIDWSSTALYP